MSATLTDLDRAVLRLAHYELQYHRLQSAALGVLRSRRDATFQQEAVLSERLDKLAEVCEEKTPGIDYRT